MGQLWGYGVHMGTTLGYRGYILTEVRFDVHTTLVFKVQRLSGVESFGNWSSAVTGLEGQGLVLDALEFGGVRVSEHP